MIQIEDIKNTETKHVYWFNIFDLNFVFVRFEIQSKPQGKRKWITVHSWDKYQSISNRISEPKLTELIRSQALTEAQKLIRIHTWDEWKKK